MSLAIRSLSVTYGDRRSVEGHAHAWGQLVYAERGAVRVTFDGGEQLVPPARALWLPPGVNHRLVMQGTTTLRSLYLAPAVCAALGEEGRAIDVSPLLRELVLHMARQAPLDGDDAAAAPLVALLTTLLAQARTLPFRLDLPRDPRARRACEAIRDDLAGERSLRSVAAHAGASVRTLQRVVLAETGVPLSEWRRTARLMQATAMILDGASVTEAGLASGYAGASAFIHAFRRRTGQTPLAFRRRAGGEG